MIGDGNSPLHAQLVQTIEHALMTGDIHPWENKLKDFPGADRFAPVLDSRTSGKLFTTRPEANFNDWVGNIRVWSHRLQDPRTTLTRADAILQALWERFKSELTDSLVRARLQAPIPSEGSVLCYVGNLSKCLVVHYELAGDVPRLQPVAIIDSPQSAFDIWTTIDHVDAAARNILKNSVQSGHKLVLHRGVLTHVDKRNDSRVFGPTIDTLVLAEILAQDLIDNAMVGDDRSRLPTGVLEIGCGSGLVMAGLVRNVGSIDEISCIDIEVGAIACTKKNLNIASRNFAGGGLPKANLIVGAFEPRFLNRTFDLIVCNPPYIPAPPTGSRESRGVLFGAVSGTELAEVIVASLSGLLAANARLLLMTSSLSVDHIMSHIPAGYVVTRPLGESGFEALFDVDDVLKDASWLESLLQAGGLSQRGGAYYHRLHPLWVIPES